MNKTTFTSMLMAFAVPGLGHYYLGRRTRSLVFLGIIVFMFVAGLALDGKLYVPQSGRPLSLLASFASMGAGLLYFVARMLGFQNGDPPSITYEYGTAFTLTAGLMNLLLILDCYDIAAGRKQ